MSSALMPRLIEPPAEMQAIDRIDWMAGVAFTSHGLKIGIRTNEPSAWGRIQECLPPGWQPLASPDVDYLLSLWIGRKDCVLFEGSRVLGHALDPEPLYEELEGAVQLHVAYFAEESVFVHAGVVAWQGRAIVIPGLSRSGKSTLVAELIQAGARYYSDEYAVLDGDGRVHPYPRRLSLRQPEGARRCSAEEMGGTTGVGPLPVGLVAVTAYRKGASWQPRPLSPGKATLELMFHTVPTLRRPESVLRTLESITAQARKIASMRGEAPEMVEALLHEAGP